MGNQKCVHTRRHAGAGPHAAIRAGKASVRRGGKQNPAGRIRAHTPGAGAAAAGLGSLLGATLCVGGPRCPSTDAPSSSRLGSLLGTKAHWLQRGSHSGATNAVPDPFVCCETLVCNGGANVAMDRQPLSRHNMHDGMPQSIAPQVRSHTTTRL